MKISDKPIPSLTAEHRKKVLIKLGYSCNNHCVFCHSSEWKGHKCLTLHEAAEKIKMAKGQGAEMIVFSGGEPTIRKDFFLLLQMVKRLGLAAGVITNGRMFSYTEFVENAAHYPLEYVYVSLHGAESHVHNSMVRTESFSETMKGIKNLSNINVFLTVNVVVTRYNVNGLDEIARLLKPLGVRLKFSLLEPKGVALEHFLDLAVDPSFAAGAISKTIRSYSNGKGQSLISSGGQKAAFALGCDGLVPCLIKNFETLNMDLFTDQFLSMSEAHENDFSPVDRGDRGFSRECYECSFKARCPGIYSKYLAVYKGFLKPFVQRQANSYFYAPVNNIILERGSKCPVGYNISSYNHERELFLQKGGRGEVTLYRTDTKDFSVKELKDIKECGQLYVNVSSRVRNIDYGRFLRKLKMLEICKRCAFCFRCPRAYVVSNKNAFQGFEKKIMKAFRKMRGRVCDVGCGDGRYFPVFTQVLEKGYVSEYVGVEPGKVTFPEVEGMRQLKAHIEDAHLPEDYFDYVLAIRSYNHFYNLSKAFDTMHKILISGGSLFLVENVPFGMIRNKSVALAYKTKPDFEHYRNHTLQEAVDVVTQSGFKVVETYHEMEKGCNQWMLQAGK